MATTRPDGAPPMAWAMAIVVGVVAVAVGFCAGWVSRGVWRPASIVVPWGLVLAVGGSVSGVLIARTVSRGHGFVAAAGWIVGVGVLLSRGDTIIAGDALGYAFLLGCTAAVIGSAAWGRGLG